MSTTAPTGPGSPLPPPPSIPPPAPPSGEPPARRPLRRSREHRVLGGVAGGVSEYFGVDVVIVRIAFVVLAWMGGSGILAYLAAWFFLPKAPAAPVAPRADSPNRFLNLDGHQLLAIALIGIGAITLFDHLGMGFSGGMLVPFMLIGIGAAVLLSARPTAPQDGFPATAHRVGEPVERHVGEHVGEHLGEHLGEHVGEPVGEFDLLRAPRAREFEAGHLLSPAVPAGPGPVFAARSRRRVRPAKTPFARSAFGLFLVSLGLLFAASRFGLLDGRLDRLLAVALFIVGMFLTLGAWMGRPRGFATIGVLLTATLGLFAVSDASWSGGFGERSHTPPTIGDVRDAYHLAGGVMHLDFSRISDFSGRRKPVEVDVSAGALAIEVPDGITVVTEASSGFGEMTLFGTRRSGTTISETVVSKGDEGKGTLTLHVHVGFGALEIARVGRLQKLTDLPHDTVNAGSAR